MRFSNRQHKINKNSDAYLNELTGLRGFAAVWVMLWHSWGFVGRPVYQWQWLDITFDLTPLIRTGWAGVDIFFVLSGFVLGLQFSQAALNNRPKVETSVFFSRRFLRVFPAYYIQLLILLIIITLGTGVYPLTGEQTFAYLLMAHNFVPEVSAAVNPVYWTLPIEFSFYLILPLLAYWVPPPHWWRLLIASLCITVFYRYSMYYLFLDGAVTGDKVWLLNQLPGRLDQFVAGMFASWLYANSQTDSSFNLVLHRWKQLIFVIAILVFLTLAYQLHYLQPIGAVNVAGETFWGGHWLLFVWHSLGGLSIAVAVLTIALGLTSTRVLLANRLMLFIGLISYSLYLWHFPVLKWINDLALPSVVDAMPWLSFLIWVIVPVLLLSTLSYWLVERPALQFAHRKR